MTVAYRARIWDYIRNTPALNRGTRFSNVTAAAFALIAVLAYPDLELVAFCAFCSLMLLSGYYCALFALLALTRRDLLEGPFELTLAQDSLRLTGPAGSSEMPWSAVKKARETNDCFWVLTRRGALYVPKSAFPPGGVDEFADFIDAMTRR